MEADNIFKLIKGEKETEDQLSASYAFLLSHNRRLLRNFLKRLDIKMLKIPKIETQRGYRHGPGKKNISIIDIHISLEDEYLIIIESKVRDNPPDLDQLQKYASLLRSEKKTYKKIRLVLVTQTNQKEEFQTEIAPKLGLRKTEVRYFRWKNLIELWRRNKLPKHKELNNMFEEYIGDEMDDVKYIENKQVGELYNLLVISVNDDFFPIHMKKKAIWKSMGGSPPDDCQFIAIYRTTPTQAITHFGEVYKIAEWVPCVDIYKGSKFEKEAKDWGHDKVFYCKRFVKLPNAIPLGKKSNRVRNFFYSEVDKLIKAKTTDDL